MPQQNPDKPIGQRVCDFFERQLAWYGLVLGDLESVQSRLDDNDLEALDGQGWCYDGDIAEQEAQLRVLLAEWQCAGSRASAEEERVRALAGRAEQMAVRVSDELQHVSRRAGARAEEVRRNLESLHESRRIFGAYRQAGPAEPGFIDEQA